jgi:formylglycine-generating enzyme required for sulfatase activity
VDFLNMLSYTQQFNRHDISIPVPADPGTRMMSSTLAITYRNGIEIKTPRDIMNGVPAVFACDLTDDNNFDQGDDGQNVACNFLTWADGAAYADWAGLRPMSELEYEKACRGHNQVAIYREYAWGNTTIVSAEYSISNSGATDEGISANYSTTAGNCASIISANGPLRVGIFAAHASNAGRMTSGSSYLGIMEMTGNLNEQVVAIGDDDGRAFTDTHGDGVLDTNGDADASSWSSSTSVGGQRGGSFASAATYLEVSDRCLASLRKPIKHSAYGFRCVRNAP